MYDRIVPLFFIQGRLDDTEDVTVLHPLIKSYLSSSNSPIGQPSLCIIFEDKRLSRSPIIPISFRVLCDLMKKKVVMVPEILYLINDPFFWVTVIVSGG